MPISLDALQQQMPRIFAPWILALRVQPVHAEPGRLRLTMPLTADLIHGAAFCAARPAWPRPTPPWSC